MSNKLRFSIMLLAAPIMLAACSGSTEDVRVTLCKDLVPELTSPAAGKYAILNEDMVIDGYEDLEVRLKFEAEGNESDLVCFYPYNLAEEGAMQIADPASAFDSYPNKVVLNGQAVNSNLLAKKINNVLLKQGKQAVDAVKNIQIK